MLQALAPAPRADLDPLLAGLPYDLPVRAILAGTAAGRLWVDAPGRPRLLLAWNSRDHLYLALRADDTHRSLGVALYEDLATTLAGQVLAPARLLGAWGLVWQHGPLQVTTPLVQCLLQGHEAMLDLRHVYAPPMVAPSPLAPPPPVAHPAIVPVDATLLAQSHLAHHKGLTDWIAENWANAAAYLEYGFGYAWVEDGRLLSYCMADYASAGADGAPLVGIGIATRPEACNRGHTTHLAQAFLAECARRGVRPHWDCWNSNLPSIAVAEKAALRLRNTYPVRFFWFNALDNAVVQLRLALAHNETTACRGWLQRVLERAHGPAAPTARLWPDDDLAQRLCDDPELAALLAGDRGP
ncbi:MAG: GNAT family N-acetyltransferase [Chloroflexota bacterium]